MGESAQVSLTLRICMIKCSLGQTFEWEIIQFMVSWKVWKIHGHRSTDPPKPPTHYHGSNNHHVSAPHIAALNWFVCAQHNLCLLFFYSASHALGWTPHFSSQKSVEKQILCILVLLLTESYISIRIMIFWFTLVFQKGNKLIWITESFPIDSLMHFPLLSSLLPSLSDPPLPRSQH